MDCLTHHEKRLREGCVGPRLLTLAGHKGKRPHEGGVGPEMRSPVGLTAQIVHATGTSVKVNLAWREQRP